MSLDDDPNRSATKIDLLPSGIDCDINGEEERKERGKKKGWKKKGEEKERKEAISYHPVKVDLCAVTQLVHSELLKG